MWHTMLITLHAISGTVAFVAGCVALRRGALFGLYLWSMAGMLLFLVLALASDWAALDAPARIVFAALAALGAAMVWRAVAAWAIRPSGAPPSRAFFDHVGFTLVALFDAFVVVTVLNLGAPGWLVAAVGVAIAVAGHFALREARSRLAPRAESASGAVRPV